MTIIDYVIEKIQQVIQENEQFMDAIYAGRGGWENWLQVEMYKRMIIDNFFTVEREHQEGEEFCDLYIESDDEVCFVELKADAEHRYPSIIKQYEEDRVKVENYRRDIGNDCNGKSLTLYAVMISVLTYSETLGDDVRIEEFGPYKIIIYEVPYL